MKPEVQRLISLLVNQGLLRADQIGDILRKHPDPGPSLGAILVREGYFTTRQLESALSAMERPEEKTLDGPAPGQTPAHTAPEPDEVRIARLNPAHVLDGFVLTHPIGRGGMGEVWRAWDCKLARIVALKFIQNATPDDERRLLREAQISANLQHPDIVPVYGIGNSLRGSFISMKFIEGATLEHADLTLPQQLRAVRDAATALEYAHRRGIIHRDIKPQNILVERDSGSASDPGPGTPRRGRDGPKIYVMDFGLAKQVASESSFSASGNPVGTPVYMPPEQARGESKGLDGRSDVYSLGATLYRLATGRAPFEGATTAEVIDKVLHDDPVAPRTRAPEISPDLQTVILKCLEKDRGRRYGTAAELAEDLDRLLNGETVLARPASAVYRLRKFVARHRALTGVAGLLFVGVLLGLHTLLWPASAQVDSQPAGARIFVNGRDTARSTPAEIRLWPPGRHQIEVRRDGYDIVRTEVDVRAGQAGHASFPLLRNSGLLTITSIPDGASVLLEAGDRRIDLGSTPIESREVPRGTYRITLSLQEYRRETDAIDIRADARMKVEKSMTLETGSIHAEGNGEGISMRVEPLDRKRPPEGPYLLPVRDLKLRPGRYRLHFERENHFRKIREVRLARDQEISLRVTLDPLERWRSQLGGGLSARVALADLNNDSFLDCIAGSDDRKVYALSGADGSTLWQYDRGAKSLPRDVPESSAPMLSDLNGDGIVDCVIGSSDHTFHALSGDTGTPLWKSVVLRNAALSNPVLLPLRDTNADGIPDCEVQDKSRRLVLSGHDGTLLSNEVAESSMPLQTPGDLDGDGNPETLTISDGTLAAHSGSPGRTLWSIPVAGKGLSFTVRDDLDADGIQDCLLHSGGLNNHALAAISCRQGTILWQRKHEGSLTLSPERGDLDADGAPDCLVVTGGSLSNPATLLAVSGRSGELLWEFRSTGSLAPPVLGDIDGDGVPECLVGTSDGRLHVLATRATRILWKFRTGGQVGPASPALGDLDGDARPDCVVGSGDAGIYALSGADGHLLWKVKTEMPIFSTPSLADLNGDGVLDGLLGCNDRRVRALSGKDGTLLWEFATGSYCPSSPKLGDFDGDGVQDCFVGFVDANLYALSGRTGSPLWTFRTGVPPHAMMAHAYSAAIGDLDADGVPDAVGGLGNDVFALSGRTGSLLWRFNAEGGCGYPTLADLNSDGVPDCIVSGLFGKLYALSGRDGAVLWEFKGPGGFCSTAALGHLDGDGVLDCIVGASSTGVYAVSGRTGQRLWVFKTAGSIHSSPALHDYNADGIPDAVLGCDDHKLYVISGKDGLPLAEFETGKPISSSPALGDLTGDGVPDCVVGSQDHMVYALDGRAWIPQPVVPLQNGPGLDTAGTTPALGRALAGLQRLRRDKASDQEIADHCDLLLRSESDPAARRFLLITQARHLLSARPARPASSVFGGGIPRESRRPPDPAVGRNARLKAILGELAREGKPSYAALSVAFIVESSSAQLVQALRADPVRSCKLIQSQGTLTTSNLPAIYAAALREFQGQEAGALLARPAIHILSKDFDLAFDEISAAEKRMGTRAIRDLRALLPENYRQFLESARLLLRRGERDRALRLMELSLEWAMNNPDRNTHATAAVECARLFSESGRTERALEIVEAALLHAVADGRALKTLESYRDSLKKGEPLPRTRFGPGTPADQDAKGILQDAVAGKITMIEAGKKFIESRKAGNPAPAGEREARFFWMAIMSAAEEDRDAQTFEEALEAFKKAAGPAVSPQVTKPLDDRLAKLKAAGGK